MLFYLGCTRGAPILGNTHILDPSRKSLAMFLQGPLVLGGKLVLAKSTTEAWFVGCVAGSGSRVVGLRAQGLQGSFLTPARREHAYFQNFRFDRPAVQHTPG